MDEKMDKTLIEDAVVYIQDLFRTNAGGHDAEHTMRVYRNTIRIAESEPDCDIQIAALAALLHDADDYKLFKIFGQGFSVIQSPRGIALLFLLLYLYPLFLLFLLYANKRLRMCVLCDILYV